MISKEIQPVKVYHLNLFYSLLIPIAFVAVGMFALFHYRSPLPIILPIAFIIFYRKNFGYIFVIIAYWFNFATVLENYLKT